jgi:hypothetical protein
MLPITDAHDPGPEVGGLPDHRNTVKRGPRPDHPLPIRRPAATAGDLGEPDRQPERYPIAGQGQDLVPDHGVRDVPLAPGSIGAVVDGQGDADGQGAGVPGVGWP